MALTGKDCYLYSNAGIEGPVTKLGEGKAEMSGKDVSRAHLASENYQVRKSTHFFCQSLLCSITDLFVAAPFTTELGRRLSDQHS